MIFLILFLYIIYLNYFFKKFKSIKTKIYFNKPENFEREILEKVKNRFMFDKNLIMSFEEYYFVNGLIRLYKPKKILEIGVCYGGMSAAILNSIKDMKDAMLYSCDLEKRHYKNNKYEVGKFVKLKFPELLNKWKLYTGNTTASFIEDIGGNIDFAYIDTAHVMPGEVLNIIEILPFLKKNAIIVFDDISHQVNFHLAKIPFFYSCNNLLFSILKGKKILFNQKSNNNFQFTKQGAIILDDNQKQYYFDYFYLLSNTWSYMPHQFELNSIRKIIKKYYSIYLLSMFDKIVEINYKLLKKRDH